MNNALREQLLKAGLVSSEQVKKAEHQSRKKARQTPKPKKVARAAPPLDSAASQAAKTRQAQAERDRELNRQRDEERRRRELNVQIRELLTRHQLNDGNGEVPYNFVEGSRVRRLYVTAEQHKRLTEGMLSVALFKTRHYLIENEVGERLLALAPHLVVHRNQATDAVDPDDPYARYTVPDDLIW